MSNVTLSSAVRANLLSLQNTQGLIDRTQGRLSTNLKVASPVDDAVKFFQAKSLSNRASDLSERKAAIDQGIQALDAALKATTAMENLVKQMKGIVDAARSGDKAARKESGAQLEELAQQLQNLVNDATYQGLNLLNSDSSKLSVRFSEKADSKLDVEGVDFNMSSFFVDTAGAALDIATKGDIVTGLGFAQALSAYEFTDAGTLASFNEEADTVIANLDQTISNLRAKASNMATNVAILNVRSSFTQEYVGVLDTGASKLTVADLNEEGANLLALQTRQQLAIQSLSFAGQSEQAILGLFR